MKKSFLVTLLFVLSTSAWAATVSYNYSFEFPSISDPNVAIINTLIAPGARIKGTFSLDDSLILSVGGTNLYQPQFTQNNTVLDSLPPFALYSFNTPQNLQFYNGSPAVLSRWAFSIGGSAFSIALFDLSPTSPRMEVVREASPGGEEILILDSYSINVVPIPASLWLFCSALAGFVVIGKRRSKYAPT